MSWGERSCVHYGKCPFKAAPATCDVDCPNYQWNGKNPDSVSTKSRGIKNVKILKGEPFDWEDAEKRVNAMLASGREIAAAFCADPGVMTCPKCDTYFWKEGVTVQCTKCGHIYQVAAARASSPNTGTNNCR